MKTKIVPAKKLNSVPVTASSKKNAKPARMMLDKNKHPIIMCPFCDPPHPINVNGSLCGTRLVVQAEQTLYKGIKCAYCGKMDGKIVKMGHFYRHNFDCSPGKILFETPPVPSKTAGLLYRVTEKKPMRWLHLLLQRRFGKVPIELHNQDGTPSGKHAWYKVR